MTIEELKKLIDTGEKIDIEFKKSENDLNLNSRVLVITTLIFINHLVAAKQGETLKI